MSNIVPLIPKDHLVVPKSLIQESLDAIHLSAQSMKLLLEGDSQLTVNEISDKMVANMQSVTEVAWKLVRTLESMSHSSSPSPDQE